MIMLVFATVYAACAALLLAAVWQDRTRAAGRRDARDARASSEFVFRTQA